MHAIVVTFRHSDPSAFGPYSDRLEAVAALELVTAEVNGSTEVTSVTIVRLQRAQ